MCSTKGDIFIPAVHEGVKEDLQFLQMKGGTDRREELGGLGTVGVGGAPIGQRRLHLSPFSLLQPNFPSKTSIPIKLLKLGLNWDYTGTLTCTINGEGK